MYRHILVAVDGSSTSDLAVQEAVKLAKEQRARLQLVHVVDEVMIDMYREFEPPDDFFESIRKAGRKVLEKALGLVRASGMEAETKLLEIDKLAQHVADMIAAEADAWPADLIVIGTHGRRGVRHLLLGSVAEGVVRCATKPVLLIRGR